jgi:hypothetical protein
MLEMIDMSSIEMVFKVRPVLGTLSKVPILLGVSLIGMFLTEVSRKRGCGGDEVLKFV